MNFASKHRWDECIVTRITLPAGDYQLTSCQKGAEITFAGSLYAVRQEGNRVAILARIAQWPPLPHAVDDELRNLLASKETLTCA